MTGAAGSSAVVQQNGYYFNSDTMSGGSFTTIGNQGFGLEASGGFSFSYTRGPLSNFTGDWVNLEGSAPPSGFGFGVSWSPSSDFNQAIIPVAFTVNWGVGGGASVTLTNTTIQQLFTVPDLQQQIAIYLNKALQGDSGPQNNSNMCPR
jgi:hypothetical protein